MVALSLSGGLDSSTLLCYLVTSNIKPKCFFFNYGQISAAFEEVAAAQIANYCHVDLLILDIRHCFKDVNVGKEGHTLGNTTIVRGRNLFFAALLSMNADEVYMGVNKTDFEVYPDCRPNFFEQLNKISDARTITPFIDLTKEQIVSLGKSLGVPFHLTRSCYTNKALPCGVCGACIERKKTGV